MRIESIKLSNFRQLRELELRFDRKTDKKDLHVIHANNGVGKTNVLNAITWCLYDKESHLQNKDTAQEKINSELCAEIRQLGGGRADVSVEICLAADDIEQRIVFKRVETYNITPTDVVGIDSVFTIKKLINNEWKNIIAEEEQLEILNKYIPETINNYIFFDGEQLEKFFSSHSMGNVKNGINELTQASYLEKSFKALNDYIKNVLNPLLGNATDTDVSQQQKKIDHYQSLIEECEKRIEKLRDQISICDDEIDNSNKIIRDCEAVKEKVDKVKQLENLRNDISDKYDEKKEELWRHSQLFFRKVALASSIKIYYDYIKNQESRGKLPPRVDRSILENILSNCKCPICNSDSPDMNFVRELEKSLDIATGTASILNKSIGALSNYMQELKILANRKDKLSKELRNFEKQIEICDKDINEIENYLRNYGDTEAIVDAINKRDEFKKERDKHIENIGREEEQKRGLSSSLEEEEKKMQQLIKKNDELGLINQKIEFCKKCKRIIEETKDEILTESRNAMQSETFKIFDKLMWKEGAFTHVKIGEDYSFSLYDCYGNQTLGSCSAAETALLALSFTLALQDISKHDSLLFIDTPIGRVDPDNRANFIRILLEVANSKQVILTFTPSEYDDDVKEILALEYSTMNQLTQKGQTTILKS